MPRDIIYAPDGTTWYETSLREAEKRGRLEHEVADKDGEIMLLRAAISRIEDQDPQIVDAARERFKLSE